MYFEDRVLISYGLSFNGRIIVCVFGRDRIYVESDGYIDLC